MAITTPYLGLKIWNSSSDPYDHSQQADNWAKVDEHDHSDGKGKQIPTSGIEDAAITAAKIDPAAFPSLSLADGAVTTPKIADGAVTGDKIGTDTITGANILDNSITSADIGPGEVTTSELANDSVNDDKLADDAVDTGAIQNNAVTADKVSSQIGTYAGISQSGTVRRGKTINTANETWAGTPGTFGDLPTPDSVATVTIPTSGIIWVTYHALWKLTGASNPSSIAIFLGSNQLTTLVGDVATPAVVAGTLPTTGVQYGTVVTSSGSTGWAIDDSTTNAIVPDTTKPQYWVSMTRIPIEIDAGAYDVSVKYKTNVASGGTLQVKSRALWVSAEGF
jgi:hypothetical protein